MEHTINARIYEKRGSSMCPVKTFELYLSRLNPKNECLWQTPITNITWEDANENQSENKIGALMTTLSEKAKLSLHYANHCVRATVVTLLDNSGFEARHIMTVSGHKNTDSIQSYATTTSNAKKREMAESLSGVLCKSPKRSCLNVSKPPVCNMNQNVGSSVENMSFRELLQLDEAQEQALLNEIFSDDMQQSENPPNVQENMPVTINSTNNSITSTAVNPKALHNIIPKMMFNNSNITINFNMNKWKLRKIFTSNIYKQYKW